MTAPTHAEQLWFMAEALTAQAERIKELERIIAYIDDHAPRADATCVEPGITLSEAARRSIKDMQS